MPSCIPFAVCFLILAGVPRSSSVEWDGFLGKFTSHFFGNDGFFDLPLTKSEAINSDPPYVDTNFQDPDFELDIFCLEQDSHVCMLYDKRGNIGGLRIAHLKSEVSDNLTTFPYKYDELPLFKRSNLFGQDAWYATFLFTDPKNLKHGGPGRTNLDETAESLWIYLNDGWKEIPRDECEAVRQGFRKQGFTRWMGNHYSYGQMNDCSNYLPYLPIYNKGRLIALSFAPIGYHHVVGERDWLETVPSEIIKSVVPNGLPCLTKWTKDYGLSSFHFYFIKHPRWILFDRSDSC